MRAAAVAAGFVMFLAVAPASAQASAPSNDAAPRPANAQPTRYVMPAWVLLPPTLAYDDGDPIPAGYALKRRMHRPLLVGGALTFGVPWVISALAGITLAGGGSTDGTSYLPLSVPVVGPFVTVSLARTNDVGQFWLTLDGVMQAAGAAMVVAGIVVEQKYLQRTPNASSAQRVPDITFGAGSTRLTWRF